jgi:hypothetical protein
MMYLRLRRYRPGLKPGAAALATAPDLRHYF